MPSWRSSPSCTRSSRGRASSDRWRASCRPPRPRPCARTASRRWSSTGHSPRPRSSCSASTSSTAANLDEVLDIAARARSGQSRRRLRDPPDRRLQTGSHGHVTEADWIGAALTAARPQAVAALLRYFRDLDTAEEAFQEACLRALKAWPRNGPPRDAAAWLIMVGKNAAIDGVRKQAREQPLPPEELVSDLSDAEADLVSGSTRPITATTSCGSCSCAAIPTCPPPSRSRSRCASSRGFRSTQIARAFLVSEAAMEQRITRAKARVAAANVPFETPGAVERSERLAGVAAMVYLIFNEGYTTNVAEHGAARRCARRPSGCRGCCCGCSRPSLRSWGSQLCSCSSTRVRPPASMPRAPWCCSRIRTAGAVEPDADRRGLALIDKAVRHRRPGPYPGAGRDRRAPREGRDLRGYGLVRHRAALRRSRAHAALARRDPQSRGGRLQGPRSGRGARHDRAAGAKLGGYFYFHGARGAFLLELGRTEERASPSTARSPSPTRPPKRHIPQPDRSADRRRPRAGRPASGLKRPHRPCRAWSLRPSNGRVLNRLSDRCARVRPRTDRCRKRFSRSACGRPAGRFRDDPSRRSANRIARGMAIRPQEAPGPGKGDDARTRRAQGRAPASPVGRGREAYVFEGTAGS